MKPELCAAGAGFSRLAAVGRWCPFVWFLSTPWCLAGDERLELDVIVVF